MRQHTRFVLLGSLLLVVSLLFAFTPMASTAFAATTPLARTSPVAPHLLQPTGSLFLTGKTAAAPQSEIDCLAHIGTPFVVSTEVEAIGSVVCTAPVSSLSLGVFLYKNGTLVKEGVTSNSGKSSITKRVTDSNCTSRASWQAEAIGTITFPPGFIPPTASFDVVSPSVSLRC